MCECSPCWSPDNILVRFSFPVHISQVSFSLHYIAEFPFFYILCLYCLLLICSSIDELLGCFHVLAIKHLFGTLLLILLYRYPEVELLHHTVILFLISWGAAILFSNGCAILHFFPTVHRSPSNFSTFLSSLVVFYCFDRSYLNGCKMAYHCSFDLHSLMDSDVAHLFMCLFVICISSMEKRPFPSSELGYFWFFFFVCLFKSFLHILDINVLSGIWFANIFSYSVNSLFTLMILSLIYKSFLNFRRFSLCYLCF